MTIDTETVLAIVAAFLPVVVAYLKKVMNEKGVSEAQVDAILDIADAQLEALEEAFPNSAAVTDARRRLLKARSIWNDPNTTVADLKELAKIPTYRTLKQ